jgi:hypothetical protein
MSELQSVVTVIVLIQAETNDMPSPHMHRVSKGLAITIANYSSRLLFRIVGNSWAVLTKHHEPSEDFVHHMGYRCSHISVF